MRTLANKKLAEARGAKLNKHLSENLNPEPKPENQSGPHVGPQFANFARQTPMANKPEAALTPQPPSGRLSFDQVVEVESTISGTRDTPLPLKSATDGNAQHVSTAAFDASTFDAAAFQIASQPPKLSNAVLSTTEGIIVPPSVAPLSGAAAFAGGGNLVANADVLPAKKLVTQNLAANTADNLAAAQVLLHATQAKIAELRDARLNDSETTDLIKFLEWLAQGLTQLVDNLDRAIAQPTEPMFLGTAADIARQLKLGLFEAIEQRRVRVWEVGAIVGVACFLSSLSGEKLASILKILFK
jgi:hypothetical protein